MCCIEQRCAGFNVFPIELEKLAEGKKIRFQFELSEKSPKNFGKKVLSKLQKLEFLEKIFELADESFHLLGSFFQKYTSLKFYEILRNLHHASHDIEHVLHAFCFLGDFSRLIAGKFIEYENHERSQINYYRTCARVFHFANHLLSTAALLSEFELCHFGALEKTFQYAMLFSAMGYALWTISLVWSRHLKQKQQSQLNSGIHFGGLIFDLSQVIRPLAPSFTIITKVKAVAGILHSGCCVALFMSQKKQTKAEFELSEEVLKNFMAGNQSIYRLKQRPS